MVCVRPTHGVKLFNTEHDCKVNGKIKEVIHGQAVVEEVSGPVKREK